MNKLNQTEPATSGFKCCEAGVKNCILPNFSDIFNRSFGMVVVVLVVLGPDHGSKPH
jgi:hypothetical protein